MTASSVGSVANSQSEGDGNAFREFKKLAAICCGKKGLDLPVVEMAFMHGTDHGIVVGAADAQRWIPVSESLPEPGETVLVSECGHVAGLGFFGHGQWWKLKCNRRTMVRPRYKDVTHWLRFPEPPDMSR